MNTPDTEMEKAELAVFWDEMAQHLPKSIERSALGDEKIFRAFATAYPKIKKHLISSRDTYWKERVRKEVEGMKKEHIPADNVWEGDEEQEVGEWKFVPKEDGMYCLNCKRFTPEEGCICGLISFEALDTLLDNLK